MTRPRQTPRACRQHGLTLIELITSIAVIGLAAVALLGVLGFLSASSGLALAQAQAQSLSQAYLSEVLALPFADPDGVDGEALRAQFDDLDDYQGLDEVFAADQAGQAAGDFRVRVSVGSGTLGTLPAADVRRVDVRVDYGQGQHVLATGYRTRLP